MRDLRKMVQLVFLGVFLIVIVQGQLFIWLGLFVIGLLSSVFFGRFYCGYICPMSTAMRLTSKLSRKLKWQTKSVPKILQTKWLPWLVLLLMVATMFVSKRILRQEFPLLLVLLLISVVVTLKYEEWVFHNHMCPYGALFNLFAKNPGYATRVDPSQCIGCKKCEPVCPSQCIRVDDETSVAKIHPSTCHQCQACAVICPKKAIHYTGGQK